ncbi:MAG: mannose-1-phosphate guanylyltransferase [Candidatus Bathyarchaeia archaeon]
MGIYAVIMAGGTGTRLWPLSTEEEPKQIHRLTGDKSLFQEAVDRVKPFVGLNHILAVAGENHRSKLQSQEPSMPLENFIVEPEGRGTAPCIGLAAAHLSKREPDSVMIVLTADHYIGDLEGFHSTLEAAVEAANSGYLVTLGIKPDEPSTGYGYIRHGETVTKIREHDVLKVDKFTEKPDKETATEMFKSGNYSWNSGMFVWSAGRIMEEFQKYMPQLYSQLELIREAIGTENYNQVLMERWRQVPRQTIDYGVMEKADDVVVLPVDIEWSDLGSWSSVMDLFPRDEYNNAVKGEHIGIDTEGSLIYGGERLIATIGVKDLIIVDTRNALLVCHKSMDQKVRDLVKSLQE